MKIERSLQINIAALTVVGTLLLGLGQNNPMLPALSLFAAVTSIYFTDMLGWFRLNRTIANLAALGALFVSMREFDLYGGSSSSQLRAIANLLVYLQFVLLYQEKNQRVFWQLGVLSLLQVVVAAALDLKLGLGLLLVVYMLTALSAMSLLFVYSQIENVQRERSDSDRGAADVPLRLWAPTDPPRAERQCSETNIQSSMLGWRFVGRLAGIGMATWLLALAVFLTTPRLGNAVWRGAQPAGGRSTGFSRDIRLGELGRVLQNPAPAMTVRILDRNGDSVVLEEAPYFRGAALSDYRFDGRQGSWSQPFPMGTWRIGALAAPPHANWHETRFSLEAIDSDVLFSLPPAYRTSKTPESVQYDRLEEQVIRGKSIPQRIQPAPIRYSVATTGIRNRRQTELWPARRHGGLVENRFVGMELDRLRQWDAGSFRGTAELTREILADADISPRRRYEAAKTLEAYFWQPGRFTYMLNPEGLPPRPADVDPIEHFLLVHRQGHCEYFASALVIMLRTQNIPARVVVGYHGGDYNTIGKYYLVRQRDAHSWVEVYLERRHVPEALLADLPPDCPGAWLRLDPTPEADVTSTPGALTSLTDMAHFMENVWNEYVLGLNYDRQRQSIYGPVVQRLRSLAQDVRSVARRFQEKLAWRHLSRSFIAWFGVDHPEVAFPWKTLLLVGSLGFVWILLVRLAWRTWRLRGYGEQLARWVAGLGWASRARSRRRDAAARTAHVDFYRRFEKLLSRRRFRRQPAQTQREFAADVAQRVPAAHLLDRVVQAYYRVRFGGRPLDSTEAAAIETTLEELGQTLAKQRS